MKKTLLSCSILMAFCTTTYGASTIDGRYQNGNGETLIVENSSSDGVDRILGGSNKSNDFQSGSVVVNNGHWNMVVGGSYLSDDKTEQNIGFNSTSVTINSSTEKKVSVDHVVGGTAGNNVGDISSDASTTRTASLTINGGEYGSNEKWSQNTLENLIIGGDHFKNNPSDQTNKANKADVHLHSAVTTINNATVNSLVIGGSLANQYYPSVGSGVLKLHVETANTTIEDSIINRPVVAGGVAMGINAISNVTDASLTISNSKVNDTIFTGGVVRYGDSQGVVESSVEKSTIKISNSIVKTIEADRGFAKYENNNWIFSSENGQALHDSAHSTKTDLLLVNSEAEKIHISEGSINFRAEGKMGHVSVNALSINKDRVNVALTANGEANDQARGDVLQLFNIGTDSQIADYDASILFEEGLVMGEVKGKVVNGKVDPDSLTIKTNSVQKDMLNLMSNMPVTIVRTLTNDVRKHLGDIRSSQGTHGVWARYDGGKFSTDENFENIFNTIQFGIDTAPTSTTSRFGVAFSYTKGDTEFGRGESDMDAFSLSAYSTWLADNGLFTDVIARMATIKNDMTVDSSMSARSDNVALSLSGELGWRFNITNLAYVEPQAELTYTYINNDAFMINDATYEIDSTNSMVGRIGLAAGLRCPDGKGDVYFRVSGVHEFLGDSQVSASNESTRSVINSDGKDTWFEYGIGANFNLTKSTYLWADIERTGGANLEEDWRGTMGIRYAW